MFIQNDDKKITSTDYWSSPAGNAGVIFFSFNAGSCRILFPSIPKADLRDMKQAKSVILSLGPAPELGNRDAYELLFDDHSESPYSLLTTLEASDRKISASEDGQQLEISVWTEKRRGKSKETVCVFRRKARFRIVPQVPCMKPWGH